MSAPGRIARYLAGSAPGRNGPGDPVERRARMAREAARRLLDPDQPRLAEARAFFAPAAGRGDAALLDRWEGAAAAGLIPREWVDTPSFSFGGHTEGGYGWRPQPLSVEGAVAVAADAAGFALANDLCNELIRLASPGEAHPHGMCWFEQRVGFNHRRSLSAGFEEKVRRRVQAVAPGTPAYRKFSNLTPHVLNEATAVRLAAEAAACDLRGESCAAFHDLRFQVWSTGYAWVGEWPWGPSSEARAMWEPQARWMGVFRHDGAAD